MKSYNTLIIPKRVPVEPVFDGESRLLDMSDRKRRRSRGPGNDAEDMNPLLEREHAPIKSKESEV